MSDNSSVQHFLNSSKTQNILTKLNKNHLNTNRPSNRKNIFLCATLNSQNQSEATFRNQNSNTKKKLHHKSTLVTEKKFSTKFLQLLQSEGIKPPKKFDSLIKKEKSIKDNKSTSSYSFKIYWKKETIEKFWDKMRTVVQLVKKKKKDDYEKILSLIDSNEKDNVLCKKLTDENFLRFYRNKDSLFPEDVFLEEIVNKKKYALLKKLICNPHYKFDKNYIFKIIIQVVTNKNDTKGHPPLQLADYNYLENIEENSEQIELPLQKIDTKLQKSVLILNQRKINTFGLTTNKKKEEIIENLLKLKLYDNESEEKIQIISWAIAQFGLYNIFNILLKDNPKALQAERAQFNNFQSDEDIASYGTDSFQFQHTIENCLKCDFEEMAIFLWDYNSVLNNSGKIPNIAAENENMEFLKYLWEKNRLEVDDEFMRRQIHHIPNQSFKGQTFKPNFSINSVIKILIDNDRKQEKKNKSNVNLNKILTWKNIDKDKAFIDSLFQYECFEQISYLIYKWPSEKFSNPGFFKTSIYKKQVELILFFLKRRDCRLILTEYSLQEFIVKEYMCKGEYLYYGAELLVYIFKNQWNTELTKELCRNVTKTIKTNDILNCHSSILTCLLLIEFLSQIKLVSIINANRCEKLINELKEYSKTIQESNPQENYIAYLMKQKDTRDRSAFQIASENAIYSLLETPEIGTIVKKMWDGTLSNNGFSAASSLHRFLFDSEGRPKNPFFAFDSIDKSKVYFFQLSVWLDSCSMRFNPIGISSICLVVIYNLFIFLLNKKGELMNTFKEMSFELRVLMVAYLAMTHCLVFNFINKTIFIAKSNRQFEITIWDYIDLILCAFSWLSYTDAKNLVGEYEKFDINSASHNFLWIAELAFTKELKNENSEFSTSSSFLLRAVILGINDILVWARVLGVLLTYKEFGPVLRMIFSMAVLLIKYIIIIAMFLACCAGIFTALLNRFSDQFIDFSTSVITLFGGLLNTFDCQKFNPDYKDFGSVMLMAYVCISAVLLINLLIAVLSNVFENMSKVTNASHRAVLIQSYEKNKWDKSYGYLLFLTFPFNLINIPVFILNCICGCEQQSFNKYATRFYYLIFYFPFILVSFLFYTFLLIPFCYIKGLIIMIQYHNTTKIFKILKVIKLLQWVFLGFFFLFYVMLRDIILSFVYMFYEVEEKTSEFARVRKNITNQDVVIFLKFIHSQIPRENRKDIHSIFMAYLDFEANEKAEFNESIKKAKEYMRKINESTIINPKLKSTQMESKRVLLYNNLEEGENASAIYTAYIRKNLMIIETLENFVIDDEEGGTYVDVNRMRKLLPLSLNIKKKHLLRLMYSDVNLLANAISKLKNSKNSFIQYQLINKIMSSAQRLDKDIDNELAKIKILREISFKNEGMKRFRDSLVFLYKKTEEIDNIKRYMKMIKTIQSELNQVINSRGGSEIADESEVSSLIDGSQCSNTHSRWSSVKE